MPLYEEIEIEDMSYDPDTYRYTYPCPCGDKFSITLEDLWDGEDRADCPSCTLFVSVIYEEEDLPELPPETDSDDDDSVAVKAADPVVLASKKTDTDDATNVGGITDEISALDIGTSR